MTSLIITDPDGPWRDRDLPVPDRVEALLAAMTLEEKVAQLGSVGGSPPMPGVLGAPAADGPDGASPVAVGHLTRVFGSAPVTVAEGMGRLRSLQERVVAGNRFGIPAIVLEDCLTGFATYGATVYPAPLAWAATFDRELVREVASSIGRDLRAVGVHQGLAPVLDVVRDYRCARVGETLGEDPYLVGQLGAAYVRGLEEAGVIATPRHFAGCPASRASLARPHRVAVDEGAAGVMALRAGVDVELPAARGCGARLVEHVRAGAVEEALVDESVRRVLRQKVELGLLDGGPVVPGNADEVDLDSADNRWLARTVAERSVVLLANHRAALPLRLPRLGRIAVVGPCSDDPFSLMGRHSFPHDVSHRFAQRRAGLPIATFRQQFQVEFPQAIIQHAPGVEVPGVDDSSSIKAAVNAASLADVVVLFVGGDTSGEGCDAPDLRLPGRQALLVEAVLATGTPTVLVVVSGRPHALGDYADRAAAVVQAFFPGVEGASAVAGVLSGRVNPSGRLPVQVLRSPSASAPTHLRRPPGAWTDRVPAPDPMPLYPFGHGLSYTTVRYETLATTGDEAPTTGSVEARVVVRNTGHRAVDEVVQLYASDPVARVARPALVGFARVPLDPGQARLVVFDVPAAAFSVTGVDGRRVVEAGRVTLSTGPSAGDLPLRAEVWLTGEPAHPGPGRRLTATHVVREP